MEEKKKHTGLWVLIVILLCAGIGYLGYMVGKGKLNVPGLRKEVPTTESVEKEEKQNNKLSVIELDKHELSSELVNNDSKYSIQIKHGDTILYEEKLDIESYIYDNNYNMISERYLGIHFQKLPTISNNYYYLEYATSMTDLGNAFIIFYYDGEKLLKVENLEALTFTSFSSNDEEVPNFIINGDSIIFINNNCTSFAKEYNYINDNESELEKFNIIKMDLNKNKYKLSIIDTKEYTPAQLKCAGPIGEE